MKIKVLKIGISFLVMGALSTGCSSVQTDEKPLAKPDSKPEASIFSVKRNVAGEASLVTQAWVQFSAEGGLLVKALTVAGACPVLNIDGDLANMKVRGAASEDFGINVCELKVSEKVQKLSIGELVLPVLPEKIEKILVLGDTGCRIDKKLDKHNDRKKEKYKYKIQDCNNPKAWPFAQLAKSAANWQPDVVIHVGDYHYREVACPANEPKCDGASWGDNWPSWQEDFFLPAQPLLRKAPWIFVRGNHELCSRAGKGWFKFLDPRTYSENCVDKTDAYWAKIGQHYVAVIDSADDKNIQPSLDAIQAPADRLIWLALHRPFLTSGADDETTSGGAFLKENLQNRISAVFTGHQHHMSFNQFSDTRPPELISGNGGTQLEKPPAEINAKDVYRNYSDFGFLTLERKHAHTWHLVEHDVNGQDIMHCELAEVLGSKALVTCDIAP